MNELRLKEYCRYRRDIHHRHHNGWTTKENILVMEEGYSLADLSVSLGRTAKAISTQRSKLRKKIMEEKK